MLSGVKQSALPDLERDLGGLDFSRGLTRDDVRRQRPNLPQALYLEIPASKRYFNVQDLLRDALNAPNRAEGEMVREDFDAFGSGGAEDDGGPAAWGEDPIVGIHDEQPPQP
jgi:hypothetical protein